MEEYHISKIKLMSHIYLGTVFSGIGAPEQAIKKLGVSYEVVFACDNGEREPKLDDKSFREIIDSTPKDCREEKIRSIYKEVGENRMELSYKTNYDIDSNYFYQDIRFLNGQDFKGKLDLLVGGSPCQAFSSNGKRGGFEDTRGTLFYEYARIIKEAQPKSFIFENVKGMLTHDSRRTWQTIKNVFNELNYTVYIHKDENGVESPVLNSCDYGIPQNRVRIYVVGIRNDIKHIPFEFPKPFKLEKYVPDYLEEKVDASYYLGQKGFEFVTTHPNRAKVGSYDMTGKDGKTGWIMNCQKANQQFNWNGDFIFEDLSEKHTQEILSKAYVGLWQGRKGVIRKFTPRECLRLMGFPESFIQCVDNNTMYRQCGNSMVVDVMSYLIQEIINTGALD